MKQMGGVPGSKVLRVEMMQYKIYRGIVDERDGGEC